MLVQPVWMALITSLWEEILVSLLCFHCVALLTKMLEEASGSGGEGVCEVFGECMEVVREVFVCEVFGECVEVARGAVGGVWERGEREKEVGGGGGGDGGGRWEWSGR